MMCYKCNKEPIGYIDIEAEEVSYKLAVCMNCLDEYLEEKGL